MDARLFYSFPEFVRALRSKTGLSQRGFAQKLDVSSGFVGQWELGLSQPAQDTIYKLCAEFKVADADYVERLVYAQRAPEWAREAIIHYTRKGELPTKLSDDERAVLANFRRLNPTEQARLAEHIEGWVAALRSEH